jgi:hypothetical protein
MASKLWVILDRLERRAIQGKFHDSEGVYRSIVI